MGLKMNFRIRTKKYAADQEKWLRTKIDFKALDSSAQTDSVGVKVVQERNLTKIRPSQRVKL